MMCAFAEQVQFHNVQTIINGNFLHVKDMINVIGKFVFQYILYSNDFFQCWCSFKIWQQFQKYMLCYVIYFIMPVFSSGSMVIFKYYHNSTKYKN